MAVFCPPGNTDAWESAINNLLQDKQQAAGLATRALEAVKEYSWIVRAKNTLQDLHEIPKKSILDNSIKPGIGSVLSLLDGGTWWIGFLSYSFFLILDYPSWLVMALCRFTARPCRHAAAGVFFAVVRGDFLFLGATPPWK